uniref:Uncharacterized protein n=1 Tax=Solanum lycopersicum TaxID=4081 RepID=A0A3Q7FEV9_SOLLC
MTDLLVYVVERMYTTNNDKTILGFCQLEASWQHILFSKKTNKISFAVFRLCFHCL